MKILLAPSETKCKGGQGHFDISNILFKEIYHERTKLINIYIELLKAGKTDDIFGLKKTQEISYYQTQTITDKPTLKAIQRYTGVAFDYLDYPSLPIEAKSYLDKNLLIFSNLFGVLLASDQIPDYRLQQGKSILEIKTDKYYNSIIKEPLDTLLDGEDILDIRAGYYDKFYKPSKPYTTLKFLKEGKVVSHWAKAYRGAVLRTIAIANINTIDDFIAMPINGLEINEIQTKGNKTEVVYNIVNV